MGKKQSEMVYNGGKVKAIRKKIKEKQEKQYEDLTNAKEYKTYQYLHYWYHDVPMDSYVNFSMLSNAANIEETARVTQSLMDKPGIGSLTTGSGDVPKSVAQVLSDMYGLTENDIQNQLNSVAEQVGPSFTSGTKRQVNKDYSASINDMAKLENRTAVWDNAMDIVEMVKQDFNDIFNAYEPSIKQYFLQYVGEEVIDEFYTKLIEAISEKTTVQQNNLTNKKLRSNTTKYDVAKRKLDNDIIKAAKGFFSKFMKKNEKKIYTEAQITKAIRDVTQKSIDSEIGSQLKNLTKFSNTLKQLEKDYTKLKSNSETTRERAIQNFQDVLKRYGGLVSNVKGILYEVATVAAMNMATSEVKEKLDKTFDLHIEAVNTGAKVTASMIKDEELRNNFEKELNSITKSMSKNDITVFISNGSATISYNLGISVKLTSNLKFDDKGKLVLDGTSKNASVKLQDGTTLHKMIEMGLKSSKSKNSVYDVYNQVVTHISVAEARKKDGYNAAAKVSNFQHFKQWLIRSNFANFLVGDGNTIIDNAHFLNINGKLFTTWNIVKDALRLDSDTLNEYFKVTLNSIGNLYSLEPRELEKYNKWIEPNEGKKDDRDTKLGIVRTLNFIAYMKSITVTGELILSNMLKENAALKLMQ